MAYPNSTEVGMPVTLILDGQPSAIPATPVTGSVDFTDLNSTNIQTQTHGLGRTPTILSALLFCTVDDTGNGGLAVDQQTPIEALFDFIDNTPAFGVACDDTNFYLSFPMAGQPDAVELNWNGGIFFPSMDNYKIVVYYA